MATITSKTAQSSAYHLGTTLLARWWAKSHPPWPSQAAARRYCASRPSANSAPSASAPKASTPIVSTISTLGSPNCLRKAPISISRQFTLPSALKSAFKKFGDATLQSINVEAFVDAARFVLATVGSLLVSSCWPSRRRTPTSTRAYLRGLLARLAKVGAYVDRKAVRASWFMESQGKPSCLDEEAVMVLPVSGDCVLGSIARR